MNDIESGPGVRTPARSRGWPPSSVKVTSTIGLLSAPIVTLPTVMFKPGRM